MKLKKSRFLIFWYIKLKQMISRQPVVNSLGLTIGSFQIHCTLEKDSLKISVACPLDDQLRTKLAVNKMIAEEESLSFWVSAVSIENCCPWKKGEVENQTEKQTEKFMLQKISEMQANFQTIQKLLSEKTSSEMDQRMKMAQERFPLEALISKDQMEISKLESLNNILQEKLVEKEGHIVALQKKLGDQDQLVHELAEKLMLANSDKDDIYNEYEKILQTTVYRSKEGEQSKKELNNLETMEDPPKIEQIDSALKEASEEKDQNDDKKQEKSVQISPQNQLDQQKGGSLEFD